MAGEATIAVMPNDQTVGIKPDDAVAYIRSESQWLNGKELRERLAGLEATMRKLYEQGTDPVKMRAARRTALGVRALMKRLGKSANAKVDDPLRQDPMDYEKELAAEIEQIAAGGPDEDINA